jgi:nicotinate-nucleotide adenylyltransferase
MNIGLYFGSFNPIHIGHLIVANVMAEYLERVWFVISPRNPFKQSKSLLHEFDRYEMVEKAIQDNHKLQISDVEFSMPKPNYTIDTLTYLSEKHSQHEFKLILGSDNLVQFTKWKNYQSILDNYGLLVYPRPKGVETELIHHPRVTLIDAPLLDISASFIRKSIREKRSIRYLVPEVVEKYIEKQGYYLQS